jgi:hydroxymethylglutaryl-CoA lyase
MMQLPDSVTIIEQVLRDGLQKENKRVPTSKKVAILDALIDAGLKHIEVTSFVHPGKVPQTADAEALCRQLKPLTGVVYSALVLNPKGLERAAAAGIHHVSASLSASDSHSRRNAGVGLGEARRNIAAVIAGAKNQSMAVQGGIQCAFGCRWEGAVDPQRVLDLAGEMLDLDVDAIMLADTTGMADPRSVYALSRRLLEKAGGKPVVLHLHDTEGKGLANVLAALAAGVCHFDAALGGMGGCPFIAGASGNVATEDLAVMLAQMNIATGLDLDRLAAISRSLERYFSKRLPAKMHQILNRTDLRVIR